jgi:hypothetical protein
MHDCQVETRRDATLVEMRREVRAMCDSGAASCYINLCPSILFSRSAVVRTKSSVVVGSVPSVSVCFVVIQFSHGKS